MKPATLLLLTVILGLLPCIAAAQETRFSNADGDTSYALTVPPKLAARVATPAGLMLVSGMRERAAQAAVGFERTASGRHGRIEGSIQFSTRPGAYGGGLLLLDTRLHGTSGPPPAVAEWETPAAPGALGIGFDTWNPPTANWFDANGNFYNRPQREVVVTWDGREAFRAVSPFDFAPNSAPPAGPDAEPATATFAVEYVPGGALVSVTVGRAPVFERRFLPGAAPCESRLAVGARTGEFTTSWILHAANVRWVDPITTEPRAPVVVRALDRMITHGALRDIESQADLPRADVPAGRIVGTLRLDCPEGGCDPWDRGGAIYVHDEKGERFELVRFMTPFGKPGEWSFDITDYAPLLSGRRRFTAHVDTWTEAAPTPATQKGWLVTFDITYHPGKPAREVLAIRNLWVGVPEYGDPDKPLDAFFIPRVVDVPEGTLSARVRLTVTGHGQAPATANAAEFLPADRTFRINGAEHRNRLWVEDCYLNSLRPQGGTWKFDRAGWCPGTTVDPWLVEVTPDQVRTRRLQLEYTPMPYVNESRAEARAIHWVESSVVFYKEPAR